jgi:glycosyltransferase involved in cell wall biosynthesis
MRIAIVHERFTELGGSERVVEQLHELWPDAPIYAAVVDRSTLPSGLRDADIRPSRLQALYRGGTGYAHLLPLLPAAFAALDLGDAELVVTSHHAFANRVRPRSGVPVISYTYTPARWLWEPSTRRGEPGGPAGRLALGMFAATQRRADRRAAGRARGIIADSTAVATRIRDWWNRDALVVAPPVNTDWYAPEPTILREDFFLLAGRLVPYKAPLVAVEAARAAGVRLVVAGDGRQRGVIERAAVPGVEILGAVDDETLRDLYRRCRALVFPGVEDFGIVPVEAQACGAPVIARGVGGVLDTVVPDRSGILFDPDRDPVQALADELRRFDPDLFDAATIRAHAERFAPDRFRESMSRTCREILDPAEPDDPAELERRS